MSRRVLSRVLLPTLLLVPFGAYVVYPLLATLRTSMTAGGAFSLEYYRALLDPGNSAAWEAVGNSVLVSLLSVAGSGLVGVLFALVATRWQFRGRVLFTRIAVLPVAMPPLVGVIAFLFVFGESGILPRVLREVFKTETFPLALGGMSAIVAVHVFSFYVYFFLFVSEALRGTDPSLIEAASGLGSAGWRTFVRVTLPGLRGPLLGASLLAFMASMASFSAPYVFGGEHRFMTVQIYTSKLNGDVNAAAAMSFALALVSMGFFLALKLGASAGMPGAKRGTPRIATPESPGPVGTLLIGASALLLGIILLPMITILLISFAEEGAWTFQILPERYTVANYASLLTDSHVFDPMFNSILMSVLTLAGALLFGVPAAWYVVKRLRPSSGKALDLLLTIPYALPGTVVGISLILAFNTGTVFTGGTVLVGTFAILPLAYWIRSYPLTLRSTVTALEQLDNSLIEAGTSCGAGSWRIFRRIVLPLVFPGIVSGSLLLLIACLGEFVSSVLLYAYTSRPVSVEILAQLRAYNFGGAAAYSVFLLVLIMVLVYAAERLSGTQPPLGGSTKV